LGDTENWWEADEDYLWLNNLDFDNTLSTTELFFQHFGFETIDKPNFKNGLEKIALFSDDGIYCSHVAKQLSPNRWSSKLGISYDVSHTLKSMENGIYGDVVMILQKV
jgi:hypothetical protein